MDNQIEEKPRANKLAVASFILGILSFLSSLYGWYDGWASAINFIVFPFSLFGIILGLLHLKESKTSGGSGRKFAVYGIILSIIALAPIVFILLMINITGWQ